MTATTQSVRKGITKSTNLAMATAYLDSNQTGLNGNAWNKVNLNSVSNDLGANFDTGNHKFIVPVTGLYYITAAVHFTATVVDKRYLIAIYKNGTAIKYAYQHTALVADLSVPITVEVFLQKDDYIELYAQPEVGGGVNTVAIVSGEAYTELTIRLETKEGIRQ